MAINKSSADESKTKKDILVKILSYLSSAEGQLALIDGTTQMSNVKGVLTTQDAFSADVADTISEGRVINSFFYAEGENNKQVERTMLSSLQDMIEGNISVEEWLLSADETRDDYLLGLDGVETAYGQADSTLTRLETAYTMADMYKTLADADIGIALGGTYRNGTNGYIYKGDITDDSIECINPNKEPAAELADPMDEKIVVASLTGAQIIDILNSVVDTYDTKGEYPYYVASGLQVEFNPWAQAGKRVLSCKLADGTDLDKNATYEVAYYNGSIDESLATPKRALKGTWKENFLGWLEMNGGTISKPNMTLTLEYN
jgi:hypothetical protein